MGGKKMLVLCCWVGALVILFIDTKTSLSFVDWLFYIIPISLLASLTSLRITITSGVAFTAFIIVGWILSPPQIIPVSITIVNRIDGIIILWFVAFLAATLRQARLRTEKN